SEFIAATAAATQALWLKRLLSKLTHSQEEKVIIQVDNKSAIALMKNPVFHGRSKHIDTKYHFIRECVEREDIQVEFVSGEYQKADILTKALPKIKFLTMRQLIGLKNLRSNMSVVLVMVPKDPIWKMRSTTSARSTGVNSWNDAMYSWISGHLAPADNRGSEYYSCSEATLLDGAICGDYVLLKEFPPRDWSGTLSSFMSFWYPSSP
ncbi:hypothetical protein Tco_1295793, partial [Tanacetum coccineum]